MTKTKNEIELERVEEQIARMLTTAQALEARYTKAKAEQKRLKGVVENAAHRARLEPHIGKAVKQANPDPKDPYRVATGTLMRIGRTRCTVDFGPSARWSFPLEDIIPEADAQNEVVFIT